MPAENKTPNLGLNQWEGNEFPKRQDFVDDNFNTDKGFRDLKNMIGNLQGLGTDEKEEIVAAINEIDNRVKTHEAESVNAKEVHGLKIETGSWTPVLAGANVAGTNMYATQSGRYIRIGNIVTVTANIVLTSKDTGMSGSILISGLPFPKKNNGIIDIGSVEQWNLDAGDYTYFTSRIPPTISRIDIMRNKIDGQGDWLHQGVIKDNTRILTTITYEIA